MKIRVYNTLSKKKEDFVPRRDNEVSMYVCGPTTYNYIHLGNARPLVFFDTVRRYLEYCGFKVTYVQNFTDIDDKIIKRAHEENMDPLELAEKYIGEYFEDARRLNVRDADVNPRVTEHMDDIIEMIKVLVDKGHAYEVQGDVYFDVLSFEGYGKLSGRSLDEMKAGARVEVDEKKRHPLDFALWKASKEGEPSWDSPWGKGRPGWHIECSAMSLKYLGMGFDIHGGGSDLIFPHHENEIAQAEAYASEEPFVRYWLHNGFITVNEEKMSKSLGNFFLVRDILKKFPGDVVRFFLLSTHYRSPLDFDDEKLTANAKALDRIKACAAALDEVLVQGEKGTKDGEGELKEAEYQSQFAEALKNAREKFEEAMNDDFNTALAIAALFDFCREANTFVSSINSRSLGPGKRDIELAGQGKKLLQELFEGVLGIPLEAEGAQQEKKGDAFFKLSAELVELLLKVREEARKKKDWPTADFIRDELGRLGIAVKDTPKGPKWSFDFSKEGQQ